jgi:sulfate adenylyltransferase subunit 1 (EFTu-like GTPase family)
MDFVDYSEEVFMNIRSGIEQFSSKLEVYDIRYIPLAALHGENIVHLSEHMPWYKGSSLLDTLENIHIASDKNYIDARFPIQHSISFDDGHSSYAGQVAGGTFRKGDEVVVLPSGSVSRISTIYGPKGYINEATPAMSVSIALADEVNANRGSMLVKKNNQPLILTELDLMVCWFSGQELGPGAEIIVRNSLSEVRGTVKDILYVIDINSFSRNEGKRELCENEIGRLKISLKHPMICDEYRHIKATGSVILIDKDTNNTVGAGLVRITHEVNN